MKYTLLDMTQRILESMGGDEVNSHADTTESTQVANIIKETYEYLIGRMDFPSVHNLFKLNASGDSTKPVLMTLPSDVLDIDYIKYKEIDNGDSEYQEVKFMDLESFINRNLDLQETDTEIDTMSVSIGGQDFTFKYYNNKTPQYYTTTDDNLIIFDAYDSSVDTTLQSSKTLCYGKKIPEFRMEDSFIPKLDTEQFQQLLNEARAQASIEVRQLEDGLSSYRARKSFIHTQKSKNNVPSNLKPKWTGFGRNPR